MQNKNLIQNFSLRQIVKKLSRKNLYLSLVITNWKLNMSIIYVKKYTKRKYIKE